MNNFIKLFLLVAIYSFLSFISCDLTAQSKISIQGTLKDAKGAAVTDGPQTVTFKLYNVTTAGTALWQETADVNVSGGIYSHYLGSVTTLSSTIFGNTLYLGVNIGSLELSPRIELTYAPYTFASKTVVCSGALGDVKYSILNPTQFAAQNGDCWVPMDGRSLSGTTLGGILTSMSNVPNGGGLFIRSQEFSNSANHDDNRDHNSPIAVFQDQMTQAHTHALNNGGSGQISNAGNHSHVIGLRLSNGSATGDIGNLGGYYPSGNGSRNTTEPMIAASDRQSEGTVHDFDIGNGGEHTHTLSGNTGENSGFKGQETRPKNINFWVYIRVN
ncbi:MAG: hypothetical protein WAR77_02540 [Saprospiraceae bacterium]